MQEAEIDKGINVCCVISDSLRWDVFVNSKPVNILKLGKVQKAHSIGNSTGTAMHGYLMNYPPIGIGKGLFVHGNPEHVPVVEGDAVVAKYKRWTELRKWMPRYFREKGYFTIWMSANPVPMRVDRELGGAYRKHFNHWGAEEYLDLPVATPQIIRDLELQVNMNLDKPIFSVTLLLDTHSPYHDGDGTTHLIDPSQPNINYEHQLRAMKYVDNVFPNFINIFSKTKRPTEFIFMSDHGENLEGRGWGHNSFRSALTFGEELFAIPFVRGRISDWSRSKVHMVKDTPHNDSGSVLNGEDPCMDEAF
uniref:Putative sulfatase n=1 Tax=viral metagenome TaxID=1070528 RepID=A0A6M3M8U0_9ZZZZ